MHSVFLDFGTQISSFDKWPGLVLTISAVIADAVRTTLGPRGMDKLMVDARHVATISNDGATIMKLLDVVHPAARVLVDIAKSQDAEVSFFP
jgi:T-complex protein 1 subunit eta